MCEFARTAMTHDHKCGLRNLFSRSSGGQISETEMSQETLGRIHSTPARASGGCQLSWLWSWESVPHVPFTFYPVSLFVRTCVIGFRTHTDKPG